jgi:hypothetical protein
MLEIRSDDRFNAPGSFVAAKPVELLKDDQELEVLDFLAAHPSLSFAMTGWIKDNGLVSKLNRGSFYATRNELGQIDGIALIGHATCFDTSSDASCAAFAELARDHRDAFLILGEEQRLNRFMSFYALNHGRIARPGSFYLSSGPGNPANHPCQIFGAPRWKISSWLCRFTRRWRLSKAESTRSTSTRPVFVTAVRGVSSKVAFGCASRMAS